MKIETIIRLLQFLTLALGFVASLIAITNLPPEKSTKGLIWFIIASGIFSIGFFINSFLLTRQTTMKIEELEIRFQANVLKTAQARLSGITKLKELKKNSTFNRNKKLVDSELKEVGRYWSLSINVDFGKPRTPRDETEQKEWFSINKVNAYKGLKTNAPYGSFLHIAQNVEFFNNVFGKNYTLLDLDEIITFLQAGVVE